MAVEIGAGSVYDGSAETFNGEVGLGGGGGLFVGGRLLSTGCKPGIGIPPCGCFLAGISLTLRPGIPGTCS